MKDILWSLAFLFSVWLFSLVNGAAVLGKPLIPASRIEPQHLTNSTILGGPPVSFNAVIREQIRGPDIQVVSCLEAAVTLLGKHLALESFTERIQPQGWSQNNVAMAVSTKGIPGNGIERRYVIWGIFCALLQMQGQEKFGSAIFTLEMRGNAVGYLALHPADLDAIKIPSSSAITVAQLDPSLSSLRNNTIAAVPSNSSTFGAENMQLVLYSISPPDPMDLFGMFINVIDTIVGAAENPKTDMCQGRIVIRVPGSGAGLIVRCEDRLSYKWLIVAMSLIPSTLTATKSLDSFTAEILLDGRVAGSILMTSITSLSNSTGLDVLNEASFNVSTNSVVASEK